MSTTVGIVGARHAAITDPVATTMEAEQLIANKSIGGAIFALQQAGTDKAFLQWDGTNLLFAVASGSLVISTSVDRWTITSAGKFVPASGQSPGIVVAGAALGTTATTGFLYIPSCAGTPTGVPATETGTVALVYDTTNEKLYAYNGAWKSVTLA